MSKFINITAEQFDKTVLESAVPVLVDFWAPWCGPCKALFPTMDALAEDYGDKVSVVKVNVDDCPELMQKYGFRAIPTVILFNKGDAQGVYTGGKSKSFYADLLDAVLDGQHTVATIVERDLSDDEKRFTFLLTANENRINEILSSTPGLASEPFEMSNGRPPKEPFWLVWPRDTERAKLIAEYLPHLDIFKLIALEKTQEITDRLTSNPNEANEKNIDNFTPLCAALGQGELEYVKTLVSFGAKIIDGNDPSLPMNIFRSVLGGQDALDEEKTIETLTYLHANGLNFSVEIKGYGTVLHRAVASAVSSKVVAYLIDVGVSPSEVNEKGMTPLDLAISIKEKCEVKNIESGIKLAQGKINILERALHKRQASHSE